MPVSRRRKTREPSPLNQLRGAGRTPLALTLARAASSKGFGEAIPWAVRNLKVAGPLAALQPRRLSHLHRLPIFDALPVSVELQWTENVLLSYADQLNAAISLRQDLEVHLLRDSGDEALSCLDAIESQSGFSLGAVATRLAIIQISKGLDAQKEEYNRIRSADVNPNLRFFAYWWSVRAEDSSSWLNYSRDFRRRLAVWDVGPELKAHIAFQVLGEVPKAGEEALLLSSSLLGSALDVYDTLLALARTALIEKRESVGPLIACCASISNRISDPRLAALLFAAGDVSAISRLCPAATTLRDASLTDVQPSAPPTSAVDFVAGGAGDTKPDPRGSLLERLAHAIAEFESPGGFDRGTAELSKLGAMFDHVPMGSSLRLVAAAPRRTDLWSRQKSVELFTAAQKIEPESLSWISNEQLRTLVDVVLPSKQHSSPAWQWSLAAEGRTCPALDETSFTARARAELALLRTLRVGDDVAILEAVATLNEAVGGETELALRAELTANLSLNGLEATLRMCVDRLLARPELAAWMPLTMLSEAIEAQAPPSGNIDVPIVLDHAAKIERGKFGPSRTYAAEDFLSARGALQPSDLASAIPPDRADGRERYFFGEVCTPANLKTSTLFNSERELETDRIAVCRWLIEADPENADRFEEEARELVRSRHIKLGIQALQGSKLSIDRSGLRRWAERAIAEDFKRYLDLLEQGLFAPDEKFRNSVYAALESGVDASQALTIPDNEAASLFAGFSTALFRELALHPEHGLDAYLSLRIRHGTLSGHLRGPVEQEHLITRKDATGRYLKNDYWVDRLGEVINFDQVEIISDALEALSSRFDDLVVRLTQDLIQVRREDKPNGLIVTDPSTVTLALMIAETLPGQSFDDFFGRCEDTFWVLVEASSPQIDAALASVTNDVGSLFERTEETVRQVAGEAAGPLKDAVLRAKANLTNAIEDIRSWLAPPTTPASLVLSVEELIRVSLAVICGFYREFAPIVEFQIGEIPNIPGVVRLFSDIFFIVFENVLKYSGNSVNPSIRIKAWEDSEHIRFEVENSVEIADTAAIARIDSARERIENGSFRRAVRGEGGTGLPKLAKVIGLGSGGGELSFGLNDDKQKFLVNFSLRKIDVIKFAEEQK